MKGEMEKLRCPKCTSKNFYYRENKNLHYKCKKCGNEFN